MPTYEFRCPKGHEFSRFYKTMSTALTELPCPECNSVAKRQLSAGAGLVFKGSGFYLTDYGKNAHRSDGGSRTADGGEKGESKPAADAAAKADASSAKPEKPAKAESKASSATPAKAEGPKPKAKTSKPKSE